MVLLRQLCYAIKTQLKACKMWAFYAFRRSLWRQQLLRPDLGIRVDQSEPRREEPAPARTLYFIYLFILERIIKVEMYLNIPEIVLYVGPENSVLPEPERQPGNLMF